MPCRETRASPATKKPAYFPLLSFVEERQRRKQPRELVQIDTMRNNNAFLTVLMTWRLTEEAFQSEAE